ncbi:DUF4101 domain-containing protein [Synechococcus sp. RSCCF101]|uniref:ARC6/PARC6 family protein n=1 Tax=Synechococcus sp. RSCCF101 TaxID=2511069 RepID=UPI0012473104|nr:ARC6/PARC6 family protein [Synechococcus sp. RSCCF101]QEY31934.1 DUF4101 domain-containing protein [Synechococcus sp. RSCCF101]
MELPIDHFRLLGVAPSADPETVLRALERRLDQSPAGDFSDEILDMRAALLRGSAERLADPEQRLTYESELTSLQDRHPDGVAGLEIASSLDLGGLLLLHEAGLDAEAFEAASRALQPPRAPALGSTRESDLGLLAALSCRAAAKEEQEARRFEASAHLLRRGSQLLQRTGQWPQQRRQIDAQLEELLPFRVLDLVSRDLSNRSERQEGLALLRDLVQRRGGLEGSRDAAGMDQDVFQAFFKQIRCYLTVQEQLDLFLSWEQNGSSTAAFLGSYTLIASGYAQRKPDRLSSAHGRLRATAAEGLEPVLACLELLLGDVESAEASFGLCSTPAIQDWISQKADDPLAVLCEYCCEWLNREVLAGYRDIEVVADLEAWFSDRDVQAYIESRDPAPAPATGFAPIETDWPGSDSLAAGPSDEASSDDSEAPAESPAPTSPLTPPWRAAWLQRLRNRDLLQPKPALAVLLGLLAALAAITWWASRPRPALLPADGQKPAVGNETAPEEQPQSADANGAATSTGPEATTPAAGATATAPPADDGEESDDTTEPPSTAEAPAPSSAPRPPLTDDAPSTDQLQELLGGWLDAKAAVLSGRENGSVLAEVARPALQQRVLKERREDESVGRSQEIEAAISGLEVSSRAPGRIEVSATVRYQDRVLGADGRLIEETAPTDLRVTYILGRDGQRWRLHEYISGR